MGFLLVLFTVVLSICVVGLLVVALAALLGSLRDSWKLKKPEGKQRQETQETH
jgi:hypothetical protein